MPENTNQLKKQVINEKGEYHEYNFDCNCIHCKAITKYFHLKTREEGQKLGYCP